MIPTCILHVCSDGVMFLNDATSVGPRKSSDTRTSHWHVLDHPTDYWMMGPHTTDRMSYLGYEHNRGFIPWGACLMGFGSKILV